MENSFDKDIVNASDDNLNSVLQTNRSLTENSLRMRAMAYLAQVKSSLLTQTIFEVDNDRKQISNYATSLDKKNKQLEDQKALIEKQKDQIEKELKEKDELFIAQSKAAMMGEMISLITHQFKQPLSVISMLSNNQLAMIDLNEKISSNQIYSDASETLKQINYLSETVDTFRDFLKPETEKTKVKIEEVIDSSLTILNKTISNNNIEIIKEYSSRCHINIIYSELMQVFMNLINNSKDAFKINGIVDRKIVIRTYDKEQSIVVEIHDNAGGISNDKLCKIFDAYFTTKNSIEGTGLGLYIVKTILHEHLGGTIEVNNLDEGVVFKIVLPKIKNK